MDTSHCKKEWNKCIVTSTSSYNLSKDKIDECKKQYDSCKLTQPVHDSHTSTTGWENFKASEQALERK